MVKTDEIKNILASNLGMISLKGFNYLVALVENIITKKESYSIIKEYAIVGKQFDTSGTCVERCIRHYRELLEANLNFGEVFGVRISKTYTNSEFIANAVYFVEKKLKEVK